MFPLRIFALRVVACLVGGVPLVIGAMTMLHAVGMPLDEAPTDVTPATLQDQPVGRWVRVRGRVRPEAVFDPFSGGDAVLMQLEEYGPDLVVVTDSSETPVARDPTLWDGSQRFVLGVPLPDREPGPVRPLSGAATAFLREPQTFTGLLVVEAGGNLGELSERGSVHYHTDDVNIDSYCGYVDCGMRPKVLLVGTSPSLLNRETTVSVFMMAVGLIACGLGAFAGRPKRRKEWAERDPETGLVRWVIRSSFADWAAVDLRALELIAALREDPDFGGVVVCEVVGLPSSAAEQLTQRAEAARYHLAAAGLEHHESGRRCEIRYRIAAG